MKVLVVAYYFPPFGGGGTERIHSFVKYWPEFGITPLVLTVDDACYEEIYLDQKLVSDYSPEVALHRSSVVFGDKLKAMKSKVLAGEASQSGGGNLKHTLKKLAKNIIVPDEQVFWLPRALAKAKQIFKEHEICAIVSTAPPFSTHLLGALLSRKYDVPLLLDYRDLWHGNSTMRGAGVRAILNGLIERWVLKRPVAVTCTNKAAATALTSHYGLDSKSLHVVENGFDASKIELAMGNGADRGKTKKICFTYLGSLTKERSPEYFFKAFKRFISDYPQYELEVLFVGYAPAEHHRLAESFGLSETVKFAGSVPKEEALDIMCNKSDVLLLLQRSTEGGATAIPGKLYEYLAVGKPLLCMDEGRGITSTFLDQLGIDLAVEYRDEEGIYTALKQIVCDYDVVQAKFAAVRSGIGKYDRKQLTQRMAELLRQIAKK